MNKSNHSLIKISSLALAAYCLVLVSRSFYQELPAMRRYLRMARM